jgi:hypothetical protein
MDERVTIRVGEDIAAGLARFRKDEGAECRSKQDAFRYIVRDWLLNHSYLEDVPDRSVPPSA